jgi:hypothetical protein
MIWRLSLCAFLLGLTACSPRMTSPVPATNYQPQPPQPVALPQASNSQTSVPMMGTPRQDRTTITRFERAVARNMRDPESTRFENTKLVYNERGRLALCGSLNTKNAFGGYEGFQTFFADVFCLNDRDCAAISTLSKNMGFEYVSQKCQGQSR